jgi:hypothetical protein
MSVSRQIARQPVQSGRRCQVNHGWHQEGRRVKLTR